MTTKMTIAANHGWPVRVTTIDPKTNDPLEHGSVRVTAGADHTIYVHSGQDILVHEIQPGEPDFADKTSDEVGQAATFDAAAQAGESNAE